MTVAEYLLLGNILAALGVCLLRQIVLVNLFGVSALFLFIACQIAMPPAMNIRLDLFLTVPLMLIAVVVLVQRNGPKPVRKTRNSQGGSGPG